MNITYDTIEDACDDLRMAIFDLLENGPNQDDYDRASKKLLNLRNILDSMMQD